MKLGLALLLLPCGSAHASDANRTLVVIPASVPTAADDSLAGVDEGFVDILQFRLSQDESIDVLDRQHLDAVLQEWSMLSQNKLEQPDKDRLKLLPAEYVIAVNVLQMQDHAIGLA